MRDSVRSAPPTTPGAANTLTFTPAGLGVAWMWSVSYQRLWLLLRAFVFDLCKTGVIVGERGTDVFK